MRILAFLVFWCSIGICLSSKKSGSKRQNIVDIVEEKSLYSDDYMHDLYHSGLRRVTSNAHTPHCKSFIEFEFMKHIRAHAEETPFPFEDIFFHSQCDEAWAKYPPMLPIYLKELPTRPQGLPPPTRVADPIPVETLSILYVLLIHNHAPFAKRIIEALTESQHTFVVHVDLKATDVQTSMIEYSQDKENVFVMDRYRQASNWGGYTIVNATIGGMMYAWETGRHFDYMVILSGTHYPIKTNKEIREQLAATPGGVYMDVHHEPSRPPAEMWHHYVECDDALHRVGRMPMIRGINMHVGSQWFAIPRHLVQWYLEDSLPYDYSFYAQHIIVADENYFATLFKNSPYCGDLLSKNLLFVLFDKWENERHENSTQRDPRKCLNPDPDQCGRSPTTLTMGFKKLLQVSKAMFARKFDPNNAESMALVDLVDSWRAAALTSGGSQIASGDEGNQFMIRQRSGDVLMLEQVVNESGGAGGMTETSSVTAPGNNEYMRLVSEADMCWEMLPGDDGVQMMKCDPSKDVQWFTFGPCVESFNITFKDGACALPQEDEEDMFCQIQSSQRNVCLDIYGQSAHAGAGLIGYECLGQWNQLFRVLPDCTITAVMPDLIARVRGFPENTNVSLCLETRPEAGGRNRVVTANCADKIKPGVDEGSLKYAKDIERRKQQFQFIRKGDPTHRAFEQAAVANAQKMAQAQAEMMQAVRGQPHQQQQHMIGPKKVEN